MRIAVVGAGAVGGYYGARLSRAGHEVAVVARGAHLQAIRDGGLRVRSPLGDFEVRPIAEEDPSAIGRVDLVLYAVKTYANPDALPLLRPLVGAGTTVLTLQNGVDSAGEVAGVVGEARVLGGAAYVATALSAPGLIEQTGTHRRIVFGEVYGDRSRISDRVARIAEMFAGADIESEPVADARVPLWEKFVYLAPFAAFTGAARQPIGPVWSDAVARLQFLAAVDEMVAVARAEGVALPPDAVDRIVAYTESLPFDTRSSLLIDLSQGKPIEVEALQGSVGRRGRAAGVPTPIMDTLYAVLRAAGGRAGSA